MKGKTRVELSVIILSYNTKEVLQKCLHSLLAIKDKAKLQIIVVDNGSSDSTIKMLKSEFAKEIELIEHKQNLGFAKGNNSARKKCFGKYVLFLNSDTFVRKNTIKKTLKYLQNNPSVGALTCKLVLLNGGLDKDARRSFPTPGVALPHFLGLDKIFPKSKIFAQYWYGFIPPNKVHEVDVIQGAYFLTRKKILDQVGWFDENYFLDGEDIDLCWKIKSQGWKIVYYPKISAIHLKGVSKGKKKEFKGSFQERKRIVTEGVRSMELFYRKRLWNRHSILFNLLIISGIKIIKLLRIFKLKIKYIFTCQK